MVEAGGHLGRLFRPSPLLKAELPIAGFSGHPGGQGKQT